MFVVAVMLFLQRDQNLHQLAQYADLRHRRLDADDPVRRVIIQYRTRVALVNFQTAVNHLVAGIVETVFLQRPATQTFHHFAQVRADQVNDLHHLDGLIQKLGLFEVSRDAVQDEDFHEELLPLSVRMFAAQRRTTQSSESIETLTRRLADQAIADYELREGEIYQLVIDQIEHALIDRALAKCGGVKTKAADFLGINRNTLNKKVKDLGIEASE